MLPDKNKLDHFGFSILVKPHVSVKGGKNGKLICEYNFFVGNFNSNSKFLLATLLSPQSTLCCNASQKIPMRTCYLPSSTSVQNSSKNLIL